MTYVEICRKGESAAMRLVCRILNISQPILCDQSPMPRDTDQNLSKRPRGSAAPRLKELLWSERSGELMHAPSRKAAPKWMGLTKAEWFFFGSVAGGAFVMGLAALQLWG